MQSSQMSDRQLAPLQLPLAQRRLAVAAARRYYLHDESKVEIARELGISRFKVARLLEQARESGLVEITLHDAGEELDEELSERLRQHLGLRECLVVEAHGSAENVRRQIGGAAATLLTETLVEGDVLGLAWGRTITAMTGQLATLPRISVIQLTGAVGAELSESPIEVVRVAADQAGGLARPIFAPFVLDDEATTAALKRQPDIAATMAMFAQLTVAVVAVGSWRPPQSRLREFLPPSDRQMLEDLGVQAEITAIFAGADGRLIGEELTRRYVSISPEELRAVPRVIAVAGGTDKAEAVLAACRADLVTSLVTDRALAEAALTLDARTTPSGRPVAS